jgi:hypothetical protein
LTRRRKGRRGKRENGGEYSPQCVPIGRFPGVIQHAELSHGAFKFRRVVLGKIHRQYLRKPLTQSAEQTMAIPCRDAIIKHHEPRALSV